VALFASHPTAIRGVQHARLKESDRIRVLSEQLARVGAQIEEFPDGLEIQPLQHAQRGSVVLDPMNDHRMAMAFGLISLRVDGIEVKDPDCVNKSFPQFWEVLGQIRG
jgi:3-phosphoshikimate 1-carboxyvinyltransferase